MGALTATPSAVLQLTVSLCLSLLSARQEERNIPALLNCKKAVND